jgi:triacylglycerol lipase
LAVYYLAIVPADSHLRRPDLAIAITELGWPAGHLLVVPAERHESAAVFSKALDQLRWLFCGTLDLWLLNLEEELAAHATAAIEPVDDRAMVRDAGAPSVVNGFSAMAARRVLARPTRAALLPRHPIVFCHGMLGYSMLKFHRPDDVNYFSVLRNFLDPRGVSVLFPKVAPTSGVAERAEQLRDQIARWTDEPINIVAHSMGGLDARHMVAHLNMAGRVRSLTTISTPHHGSHMADWFQANFRRRVPLLLALEAMGINVNGFSDCLPAACREFNKVTPNSPNIRYFSFGGDVPAARLTPFLRRAWGILTSVEGPNDGLVSVRSARWGEYLGTIQADHFAQTPDGVFVRDGEDFDALGFYVRLIEDLARRGF